jgi:ribose transport system substrate-binding protein
MAAGIPVVLCGNGLPDPSAYASVVTVDYWTTGLQTADALANDMDGKGKVVIMGGNPAYEHTQIYELAAKETFKRHPGIDVVATTYSEYSIAKGKTDLEAVLTSNPEIDGIYSIGSEAAIGGIQAMQERGVDVPPMAVSNDINGFVRLADEVGFKYTAAPAPAPMAAGCVDTAVSILKGEADIPRFQSATDVVGQTSVYDESQLSDHYWPEFNDDFVGPPVAPEDVYLDAGFGR